MKTQYAKVWSDKQGDYIDNKQMNVNDAHSFAKCISKIQGSHWNYRVFEFDVNGNELNETRYFNGVSVNN